MPEGCKQHQTIFVKYQHYQCYNTASEFCLSNDALEFVVIQKKQKINWCETEKTKGEVIELTSDVCCLQSVSAEGYGWCATDSVSQP